MSRKKLSEFRAKALLNKALGQAYQGVQLNSEENWQAAADSLDETKSYVVKVDQAEKGRFKKGLVKLKRSHDQVAEDAQELFSQGFQHVLVEEYAEHDQAEERYLTIERVREGSKVSFSKFGGVDVESHAQEISSQLYDGQLIEGLEVDQPIIEGLIKAFDDNYFSFLEINPFLPRENSIEILDAAVEVDDEAAFFEDGWELKDIRSPRSGKISEEELIVQELSANSQASFSLERINENGSIWLLLSGGGASVVVADEVYNLGFGEQLGNYGEYSGNPNTEETQHYTEQVIKLMLKSQGQNKILIIGGGVANFTDVRQTFKGVIAALKNHEQELKDQHCAVYVRRGGPHEKAGLQLMRDYLE
ncbi:MAG TPA: ATP citrate lyase citrate-binding domain-containing protein, partial [Methylomirabilota bacterium]|nr:ATP citrate lyase citrate-binding domain-containing protein [Methylomirabilota bacterium]